MKKIITIAVISVICLFFIGLMINVKAPEHTAPIPVMKTL